MQGVLESVNEKEAKLLRDWFVRYPSPPAIQRFSRLAGPDYAAHYDLAFALAAMGDTNVVNWAVDFVKKPGDKAWVGYYVFAWSPLPAADVQARQLIQRGDSEPLVWLVQGYEDSPNPERLDRIKEAMAIKDKSRKLTYWLRRVLEHWAREGDPQAASLLSQLPVVEED